MNENGDKDRELERVTESFRVGSKRERERERERGELVTVEEGVKEINRYMRAQIKRK